MTLDYANYLNIGIKGIISSHPHLNIRASTMEALKGIFRGCGAHFLRVCAKKNP